MQFEIIAQCSTTKARVSRMTMARESFHEAYSYDSGLRCLRRCVSDIDGGPNTHSFIDIAEHYFQPLCL